MATRHSFAKGLEDLHLDLIKMGTLVEESIIDTILALKKQDVELATKIIRSDDEVDELERKIEKMCLNLIARQQPLAKDLRTIGAALKIITDMERIADHSSDIAELTIKMSSEKYIKPIIDIPKMANLAKEMVHRSIDAYVRQDMILAEEVRDSDDTVDELFIKISLELINIIKKDVSTIDQAIDLMLVAKYLERMGDHATNIAEWVIFNVTGEHERHKRSLFKVDINRLSCELEKEGKPQKS